MSGGGFSLQTAGLSTLQTLQRKNGIARLRRGGVAESGATRANKIVYLPVSGPLCPHRSEYANSRLQTHGAMCLQKQVGVNA